MRIFLACLVSLFMTGQVFAVTLEEDVVRYANIFSGDRSLHTASADGLAYAGISDLRVFDTMEHQLLTDIKNEKFKGDDKARISRFIRALGYSGQEKYLPTIQSFVNDSWYGRYAYAALADLPNYKKWNAIISNRATFVPTLSDDANRVLNMLKSDDVLLIRLGAKRVYFENRDELLLEQLAADLTTHYRVSQPSRDLDDSIGWMAKGLGTSKSERYRPLLEEVAKFNPSGQAWSHAKTALERYSR